jgi:hypothetical protein
MFGIMEPVLDSFSRQIERHLKETDRREEAAALQEQHLLTRLLDMLIVQIASATDLRVTEIEERLRNRYIRGGGRETSTAPQAFLTPIGFGRQALIADFEAIASHVGELSMSLQKGRCDSQDDRSEIDVLLTELCANLNQSSEIRPKAESQSLKETLAGLESPGELSDAYRLPNFSDRRLKSTQQFLR